ncbi:archaemetzincin-2-like [Ylistrum balloti]|uniref:archaemetzincin-2-like n=1 Tax=Ylistrum balloti TaxID=509963 RepID=UPI0029059C90|nr:archaemetzincin-2-like [Ylistrum balloti]
MMGSSASKDTATTQQKFLIGSLTRKSDLDQKFFKLSYHCLTQSPTSLTENRDIDLHEKNEKCFTENQHIQHEIMDLGNNDAVESIGCRAVRGDNKRSSKILNHNYDNECMVSVPDLFLPILGSKKLVCAQTYVAWRSIMDLEKLKSLLVKRRLIYLVQVDDFPDFLNNFRVPFHSEEITIFDLAEKFLGVFFTGMTVKWIQSLSIAERKWDITSRHHKKTGKFQYLVTDFFPLLANICPKDGYCIMGLIWSDLYPKEELNFVLGEAHNSFKSGIVSFGRFEPKTYIEGIHQDIISVTTEVVWKLLKCLSHELCHLFGMAHCDFFGCTMNGSGSVKDAMDQPLFLCPVCVRKLQHICKFDILERYENMEKFLVEMNKQFPSERWNRSMVWIQNCLKYLKTTATYL